MSTNCTNGTVRRGAPEISTPATCLNAALALAFLQGIQTRRGPALCVRGCKLFQQHASRAERHNERGAVSLLAALRPALAGC